MSAKTCRTICGQQPERMLPYRASPRRLSPPETVAAAVSPPLPGGIGLVGVPVVVVRCLPWSVALAFALLACGCVCSPGSPAPPTPVSRHDQAATMPAASAGDAMPLRASPFHTVAMEAHDRQGSQTDRTAGNRVLILDDADDALLVRAHLIRHATRSIRMQTFIWTNDEVGRFMMLELIEAAKRGVLVQIIADHFVSDKDPDVVAFLATVHPNLQIKHYRPAAERINPAQHRVLADLLLDFRGFNQRMHNKVLLVDDVAVITGGRNVENTYFNRSTGMTFRDRDVLVVGPAAIDVSQSFDLYWNCRHVVPSQELRDVAGVIRRGAFRHYRNREDFALNGLCDREDADAADAELIRSRFVDRLVPAKRVAFVADKPGKNRAVWLTGGGVITHRLVEVMEEARSEVVIQSPYFVLGFPTRRFFRACKRRNPGLRVVVSTNSFGSTDNTAAYSANYRLRSAYIDSLGLEIYEYKPHPADLRLIHPAFDVFARQAQERIDAGEQRRGPFLCLHAKSAVFDGRIAYIGSYNLDPRSANLNTECGFIIEDEAVAAQLRDIMLRDCRPENSWVIARRQMPLSTDKLNAMIEGIMRLSPIDVWPIRHTTSFELLPDRPALPPNHPDFYDSYRDAGTLPGAPPGVGMKEVLTVIFKTVGPLAVPIL